MKYVVIDWLEFGPEIFEIEDEESAEDAIARVIEGQEDFMERELFLDRLKQWPAGGSLVAPDVDEVLGLIMIVENLRN